MYINLIPNVRKVMLFSTTLTVAFMFSSNVCSLHKVCVTILNVIMNVYTTHIY